MNEQINVIEKKMYRNEKNQTTEEEDEENEDEERKKSKLRTQYANRSEKYKRLKDIS